jgi:coenzyme F420-reducing hydrogenase delta subunit
MMHLTRKILEHIGVNPQRLRLEWVSASQGIRFAEIMNDVSKRIKELGPLGKAKA